MSETFTKINATVDAFVASYRAAFDSKDASALSATLSPDCTRLMQPQSFADTLGLQHNPISIPDYEAIARSTLPNFEVGRIDIDEVVIDAGKRTATFRMITYVQLKDGVKDIVKFVFKLDLTESCDQVKAVVQTADTAKSSDMVARMKEEAAD